MSDLEELLAKAAFDVLSFSPQKGKPGSCSMAQIWDEVGNALAQIEPTRDPEMASAQAAAFVYLVNNAPALLRSQAERIQTLEAALKPFVQFLAVRETQLGLTGLPSHPDDTPIFGAESGKGKAIITLGDFRRARQSLSGDQGTGGGE